MDGAAWSDDSDTFEFRLDALITQYLAGDLRNAHDIIAAMKRCSDAIWDKQQVVSIVDDRLIAEFFEQMEAQ